MRRDEQMKPPGSSEVPVLSIDSAALQATLPEPSRLYRWSVLLIVGLAMGCNYYVYDSINPLEHIFVERLGFTATDFGWLNSAYAVTAVLTLLLGGIIIDRFGTKRAILAFAVVCCLGASLTAAYGSPVSMIAGRAVLGLGGESLVVAATTAIARWFKGKELSFAFGIKIALARVMSVAADNSPTWAHKAFYPANMGGLANWRAPLLIAAGAGFLAIVCAAFYWSMEDYAERHFSRAEAAKPTHRRIDFAAAFRLGPSYWLAVGICFAFYSAIFPFRTFAIDFLTNRLLIAQGGVQATEAMRILAHKQAGMFTSLLPLSAMFVTPLLGLLSDRIGRRASMMLLAAVLLMPVYLMLGYTGTPAFLPLCMMGVAFAVMPAVIWSSVAYIVDPRQLGTAYALMTLIEQIGFFVMNLLIGRLNDSKHAGLANPDGYRPGMLVFTLLAGFGLACSAALFLRERGPKRFGLEQVTVDRAPSGS